MLVHIRLGRENLYILSTGIHFKNNKRCKVSLVFITVMAMQNIQ